MLFKLEKLCLTLNSSMSLLCVCGWGGGGRDNRGNASRRPGLQRNKRQFESRASLGELKRQDHLNLGFSDLFFKAALQLLHCRKGWKYG